MKHEDLIKMSVKDLEKHVAGLIKASENAEGEALAAIVAEVEGAKAIIEDAKSRARLAAMATNADPEDEDGTEQGEGAEEAKGKIKAFEERGAKAKSGAAVKFSAKTISRRINNALSVTQTAPVVHTASDVKETFNDVSGLIDRVKAIPLNGGETYTRGFVKSYGTGGAMGTAEGGAYSTNEPVFGYVTVEKQKVTAYTEEPEEMAKLPNADYDGVIEGSVTRAIRRIITRQIINGDGSTGNIKGIFFNPSSASDDVIDRDTDITLDAIDNTTLDEIIYSYGGDEDVEAIATLILNKADLKAFAMLRDQQGRKVYTIVNNGNTGTIDGVPFIINGACDAVSAKKTAATPYCMAYGVLDNFELAIFSDVDARKSEDFKFSTGQIAYRASTFVGGAVVARNGFIRVKRKANA